MPSERFGKKRTNEQYLVCKDCLLKKAESRRDQTAAENAITIFSLEQAYDSSSRLILMLL